MEAELQEKEQQPEEPTVVESLVEHVESYTRTTVELAKLKTILKASEAVSNLAVTIVMIVLSTLTILFLSVGAALWIGHALDSAFCGFFIIAGFYGVLGLFVYLLRKKLVKKPVADSVINHFID